MTAFMALNDGVPRNMPAARKPSAVDVELLHSHMREGQEKYASRRGQVLNEPESLDVGLIVNVRATPTELAKQYALGIYVDCERDCARSFHGERNVLLHPVAHCRSGLQAHCKDGYAQHTDSLCTAASGSEAALWNQANGKSVSFEGRCACGNPRAV